MSVSSNFNFLTLTTGLCSKPKFSFHEHPNHSVRDELDGSINNRMNQFMKCKEKATPQITQEQRDVINRLPNFQIAVRNLNFFQFQGRIVIQEKRLQLVIVRLIFSKSLVLRTRAQKKGIDAPRYRIQSNVFNLFNKRIICDKLDQIIQMSYLLL